MEGFDVDYALRADPRGDLEDGVSRSAPGPEGRAAHRARDALGLDGFVAELNPGGALSTEQMHRTLRILTHQVMPALN